jgi:hypothetical protein
MVKRMLMDWKKDVVAVEEEVKKELLRAAMVGEVEEGEGRVRKMLQYEEGDSEEDEEEEGMKKLFADDKKEYDSEEGEGGDGEFDMFM